MRKITRKGLIRQLDDVVRQLVKLKGTTCVCCGKTENMTCGHLITRSKYSVRWDLMNCWPQCAGCNYTHEFNPHIYINWFINSQGLYAYRKLVKKSNIVQLQSDKKLKTRLKILQGQLLVKQRKVKDGIEQNNQLDE
jgi:hypothetical protein